MDFWDWNTITFLISLSFFQTFPYLSPHPFNFMASFFISCYCICVCVCRYIPTENLFGLYISLWCMVSHIPDLPLSYRSQSWLHFSLGYVSITRATLWLQDTQDTKQTIGRVKGPWYTLGKTEHHGGEPIWVNGGSILPASFYQWCPNHHLSCFLNDYFPPLCSLQRSHVHW